MMLRVRLSRWLGRVIFGQDAMVSTIADQRQWRLRHAINALFWDRQHCARANDWECRQRPEADPLAEEWLRPVEPLDARLRVSEGL